MIYSDKYILIWIPGNLISFLRTIERLVAMSWGYMNIPTTPNCQAAIEIVRQYLYEQCDIIYSLVFG